MKATPEQLAQYLIPKGFTQVSELSFIKGQTHIWLAHDVSRWLIAELVPNRTHLMLDRVKITNCRPLSFKDLE